MAPPAPPPSTLTAPDKAVLAMSKSEYLDSLHNGSRNRQYQRHQQRRLTGTDGSSSSLLAYPKKAAPHLLPRGEPNILSQSSTDTCTRPFQQRPSLPPNVPLPPLPEEGEQEEEEEQGYENDETVGAEVATSSFFAPRLPDPPPSLPPLDMILSQITLAEEARKEKDEGENKTSTNDAPDSTAKSSESECSPQVPSHTPSDPPRPPPASASTTTTQQDPDLGRATRRRTIVDKLTVGVCIVQAEPRPAVLVARRRRCRPKTSSSPPRPPRSSSSSPPPPAPPEKDWYPPHMQSGQQQQQRQEKPPTDTWDLPSGPVQDTDFCVSAAVARVVEVQLGLKVFKILGVLRPRLEWETSSDSSNGGRYFADFKSRGEGVSSSDDEATGGFMGEEQQDGEVDMDRESSSDEYAELEGEMLIGADSMARRDHERWKNIESAGKIKKQATGISSKKEKTGQKRKARILRLNYIVQVYEQDPDYLDESNELTEQEGLSYSSPSSSHTISSSNDGPRANLKCSQPRRFSDIEESEEESLYDAVLWAGEKELIECPRLPWLHMSTEIRSVVAEAVGWAGGKWSEDEEEGNSLPDIMNRRAINEASRKQWIRQNHLLSTGHNENDKTSVSGSETRYNNRELGRKNGHEKAAQPPWPVHTVPAERKPLNNQPLKPATSAVKNISYSRQEVRIYQNDNKECELPRMHQGQPLISTALTQLCSPVSDAPTSNAVPEMSCRIEDFSAPSIPTTTPGFGDGHGKDASQHHKAEPIAANMEQSQQAQQIYHPQPIRTPPNSTLSFFPSPSKAPSRNFFSPPPLTLSPLPPTPPLRFSNKPLAATRDSQSPTSPPPEILIPEPLRLLPCRTKHPVATPQHDPNYGDATASEPLHPARHHDQYHSQHSDKYDQSHPSQHYHKQQKATRFSSSPPPPVPSSPSPPPLPTPATAPKRSKSHRIHIHGHNHHNGQHAKQISSNLLLALTNNNTTPRRPLPPAGPPPRRGPPPKRPVRGPDVGLGGFTGTKTGSLGEMSPGRGLVAVIEDSVGEEREEIEERRWGRGGKF